MHLFSYGERALQYLRQENLDDSGAQHHYILYQGIDYKCFMAEGEGFEPPVPFQAQRFSRPPVSTAHPSLRGWGTYPVSPVYRNFD